MSTKAALVLLLTMLAAANISRSAVVPGDWHFVLNVAIAVAALLIAGCAAMSPTELGLDRFAMGSGVRFGAVAFVAIGAVIIAAGVVGLLENDQTDVSAIDMLWRTVIVIPVGTVLVEELAFRGVLQGLLMRLASPARSIAVGAVLFGMWHVYPAWRDGAIDTGAGQFGRTATVAGTLLATTVAGVGFGWLRWRSRSVLAPMLAHTATNSVTFAVAWLVA